MATKALRRLASRVGAAFFFLLPGTVLNIQSQGLNTLTPAQRDSGWVLLFDGKTTFGWHKKQETVTSSSWVVNDSAISRSSGGNVYSPVTAESFELSVDWKISNENGNSGIWLRMIETVTEDQRTGPEIQIVGKQHGDYGNGKTTAGACYSMYEPNPHPNDWIKPAGQWNNYRVIMDKKHVEHWGNGVKMVEYEIDSPDWTTRKRQSTLPRVRDSPRYGEVHYGSIVLTDHSTPVWYRNIRIRPLSNTQIRSAFPGFVIPTVSIIARKPSRHVIIGRDRLENGLARTGLSLPLLSLDGRSLTYRSHRSSAGAYVARNLNTDRDSEFQKVILP